MSNISTIYNTLSTISYYFPYVQKTVSVVQTCTFCLSTLATIYSYLPTLNYNNSNQNMNDEKWIIINPDKIQKDI